ncbi:MAG TPA: DUF3624 family protein [Bacteroidia bacterium]|nr:DUF3624 family protein [Bacteroidia bacterium]
MEQTNEGCSGCNQEQSISANQDNNVSVQQNAPCTGCRKNQFKGKLGTCIDCIVANIIGTILGWLVFLSFLFFYPDKRALYATIFISGLFTLLLSAHGIAYLIKRNKVSKK